MKEKSRLKPNELFFSERSAVAREILASRNLERSYSKTNNEFEIYRDAIDYIVGMGGLSHALKQAKDVEGLNVLDLGAGSTKAISQFRDSEFGKGLNFYATTLSHNSAISENLGNENTAITSIESFRSKNIPMSGYGLVMSNHGFGYSDKLGLATGNLKNLLVDGGVFKASMPYDYIVRKETRYGDLIHKEPEVIYKILQEAGFDVFLAKHVFDGNDNFAVITAVKNGNSGSARVIYEADLSDYLNQARKLAVSQKDIEFLDNLISQNQPN